MRRRILIGVCLDDVEQTLALGFIPLRTGFLASLRALGCESELIGHHSRGVVSIGSWRPDWMSSSSPWTACNATVSTTAFQSSSESRTALPHYRVSGDRRAHTPGVRNTVRCSYGYAHSVAQRQDEQLPRAWAALKFPVSVYWKENTCFQSFFMLMTVQPSVPAVLIALPAPA